MAEQQFFYNTVSLTAGATARSLYDLVTDTVLSYALPKTLPGQCVALNFSANVDIKIGFSGQLDDSNGTLLAAGSSFVDSATGDRGNTIPIGQIYLFSPTTSGTATVIVYLRFIG